MLVISTHFSVCMYFASLQIISANIPCTLAYVCHSIPLQVFYCQNPIVSNYDFVCEIAVVNSHV